MAALENILTANQNSDIYQVVLNRKPRHPKEFEKLKKRFHNFHYLFQSPNSYFKGSLFQNHTGSPRETIFKAQLLILWRYGGTVLAPKWLTLKPLSLFQNGDPKLIVGSYNGNFSFMSAGNTCNAKVYEIMQEIKKNGFVSEIEAIDKVILKSKNGIRKISFPEICSNHTINQQCVVMRSFEPDLPVNIVNGEKTKNGFYGYLPVMPTYVRRFFIFSP